jgi:hypothetical protein
MNNKIFESIINSDELYWEDYFYEIDFDLIVSTKKYDMMLNAFNRIYINFMRNKIHKYDLDNFVNLARKIAQILNDNIECIEQKLKSKDGSELPPRAHNVLYCSIITFLKYDEAKIYKHKVMKNGKFYYDLEQFHSFKELYLYTQNIVAGGMLDALSRNNLQDVKLLAMPCKM